MRAFELAASQMWAIREDVLDAILAIAVREGPDPGAASAKPGGPLGNARSVTMRDGVAVIPITGPIFRYANLFSHISGAVSLEMLSKDINAAAADPAVQAILLDIDSPGGQVNGLSDLAAQIHAARDAKPIIAYISGAGCSGAYWLACAASEIAANPTAMLGSIGVYAAMPNCRPGDTIEFVSSVSPNKAPNTRTAKGLTQLQAEIDSLGKVFVEDVAKYRGVSVEAVLEKYGQGGVFIGAEAVAAGLADRLGTFEETLAGLSGASQGGNVMPKTYAEAVAAQEISPITASELRAHCADLVAEITAQATEGMAPSRDLEAAQAQAVEAERNRLMGLVKAVAGEAAAGRLERAAAAGCTAEQAQALVQALGGFAGTGGEAAEASKRQEALAAIKGAGAEAVGIQAGSKPRDDEPGDFKGLVAEYRKANRGCSLGDAQKAVAEEYPKAYQAYLDEFNQAQAGK